jgi:hypothetical protein
MVVRLTVGWAVPALSMRTNGLTQKGRWQRAEVKSLNIQAFLLFQRSQLLYLGCINKISINKLSN